MTELERRQKFVECCESYLGCRESDGSHRQIIDLYNTIRPLPRGYKLTYTDPWCAGFPSAVAQRCGMTDIIYPECSCDAMIELYKAAGRWQEADNHAPRIGDLIMYDWNDSGSGDNTGSADHVGVVAQVSGSSLTIIEGNISDSVDYRRISVNARFIRGYCLPDYASAADETADGQPAEIIVSGTDTKSPSAFDMAAPYGTYLPSPLRILRHGMEGPDVAALQCLLEFRGYACGAAGADGKMHDDTTSALKRFQTDREIGIDGEFGPESFGELWGR